MIGVLHKKNSIYSQTLHKMDLYHSEKSGHNISIYTRENTSMISTTSRETFVKN